MAKKMVKKKTHLASNTIQSTTVMEFVLEGIDPTLARIRLENYTYQQVIYMYGLWTQKFLDEIDFLLRTDPKAWVKPGAGKILVSRRWCSANNVRRTTRYSRDAVASVGSPTMITMKKHGELYKTKFKKYCTR